MSNSQVFTVAELNQLSMAASGPDGGLDVLNSAQQISHFQFEGIARAYPLRPGLSVLYTELTAKQSFEMSGQIGASFNVVMMSGGGIVEVDFPNGESHRIFGDQTFLISVPDTANLTSHCQSGNTYRSFRLRLFPDRLTDANLAEAVRQRLAESRLQRFPYFADMSAMLPLLKEPVGGSIVGQLAAESIALELLARLFCTSEANGRDRSDSLSAADRAKLFRIRDLVVADPSRDYRLKELAAAAGIGLSTLKAKFPVLFGRPVIAFLREVRLDRARHALENDGLSVTEAAAIAGYRHVSTFSSAFRKRYGVPPSGVGNKKPES